MKWIVEAKGWVGLCPVWIAEEDSYAPCFIPRPLCLDWWFRFNIWIQDTTNFVLAQFVPEFEPVYALHHVQSVEPFEITVPTDH